MRGARLNDANLDGADLNGTNLDRADLNGARLKAILIGPTITQVQLNQACGTDLD